MTGQRLGMLFFGRGEPLVVSESRNGKIRTKLRQSYSRAYNKLKWGKKKRGGFMSYYISSNGA
jgi:hypothetical protein